MRVLHDVNTYVTVAGLAVLYYLDAPWPFGSVLGSAARVIVDHVPVVDARLREAIAFSVLAHVVLESAFWLLVGSLALAERLGLLKDYKLQSADEPAELTREARLGVVVSHWLLRPVSLTALHYFALHGRVAALTSPLPSFRQGFPLFVACMLIDDTYFYWAHRACHTRALYAWIHKKHHMFHHPNVWATEYAHPLEDLLVNSAGTVLGPIVLRAHPVLAIMYVATKLYQSMEAHSGYNVPFPFSLASAIDSMDCAPAHDFHHSHNTGNFGGFFMFWDWLCGTDASYEKLVMVKKRDVLAYKTARRPYEHGAR